MINILASLVENPNCIVDVVDWSEHMSVGGKRDAFYFYICQQMLHQVRIQDILKKGVWINCFGGASNVQKAGQLIEQYIPRCSIITGFEHTVSITSNEIDVFIYQYGKFGLSLNSFPS